MQNTNPKATNTGKTFSQETKIKMHRSAAGITKKSNFTAQQEQQIIDGYKAGVSIKLLAENIGVSKTTIVDFLTRKNLYVPSLKSKPNGRNLYSKEIEQQIAMDYKTGEYSYTDLGKKYSINGKITKPNVIAAIIKRN